MKMPDSKNAVTMPSPDISGVEGLGICCRSGTDYTSALATLFRSSKKEFHIIFFCENNLDAGAACALKSAAARAKKIGLGLHISVMYSGVPSPGQDVFPSLDFTQILTADCQDIPGNSALKRLRAACAFCASCGRTPEAVIKVAPQSVHNLPKLLAMLARCGVRAVTLLAAPSAATQSGGMVAFAEKLRPAVLSANERRADNMPALQINNTLGMDEPGLRPPDIVFCNGKYFHFAAWFCGADESFALQVPKNATPSGIIAANPGPLQSLSGKNGAVAGEAREWLRVNALIDKVCQEKGMGWTEESENPWFTRKLLCADIFAQRRFLRRNIPAVESAFFFVPAACLNDCIFCCRKKKPRKTDLSRIYSLLAANRALGHKKVCVLGNEPALEPRLPELISRAKECGFSNIEMLSSGAPFADAQFCKKMRSCGLTALSIPLFAPSAKEHDAIVQKRGAFTATLRGIHNALDAGIKVYLHSNALKQNLALLPELAAFVRREFKTGFCIFPPRPKGDGGMNIPYRELMPSYAEIIAALAGRVDCLGGFPACVEREVQGNKKVPPAALADCVKLYMLHQAYAKPAICRNCIASPRCLGTFGQYLELFGDGELSPLR
jgi:hypothetical protein